jgi:hypothetical protein
MASGVLDKLLTYLFKSALRVVHYFESYRWERTEALVTGHIVHDPIWWGRRTFSNGINRAEC